MKVGVILMHWFNSRLIVKQTITNTANKTSFSSSAKTQDTGAAAC